MEIYEGLPQTTRLTQSTFDLFKMDWAGGEKDWPLREWMECLQDWLMNGSGFFQGYSSLNAEDKACFDAMLDEGQKILAEISSLRHE